ncbi:MAG: GTPase [Actinomycetota bacterium]|nr:GTPase [Actinomycetota bacterium]
MNEGQVKSGFVAVVGRPNVGKSTLLNQIMGGKVAITSDKPQTTRTTIRGILDRPDAQVVFVDTPGYHKPRTLLGQRLNSVVRDAWSDVDLALFVVDGHAGVGRGDEKVAADLQAAGRPTFLVLNKVDRMNPGTIAKNLSAAAELGDFKEFFPVSAMDGDGVEELVANVVTAMPEGPRYYPAGTRTDQPPPIFVAELVREKLLHRTREELPHSIAVVTEDFEEREDGLLEIRATIFVERDSQKGIVVGKGGATIKAVGTEAREEIEALFGCKVYLELHAKVEKDWQRRSYALEKMGYPG